MTDRWFILFMKRNHFVCINYDTPIATALSIHWFGALDFLVGLAIHFAAAMVSWLLCWFLLSSSVLEWMPSRRPMLLIMRRHRLPILQRLWLSILDFVVGLAIHFVAATVSWLSCWFLLPSLVCVRMNAVAAAVINNYAATSPPDITAALALLILQWARLSTLWRPR